MFRIGHIVGDWNLVSVQVPSAASGSVIPARGILQQCKADAHSDPAIRLPGDEVWLDDAPGIDKAFHFDDTNAARRSIHFNRHQRPGRCEEVAAKQERIVVRRDGIAPRVPPPVRPVGKPRRQSIAVEPKQLPVHFELGPHPRADMDGMRRYPADEVPAINLTRNVGPRQRRPFRICQAAVFPAQAIALWRR